MPFGQEPEWGANTRCYRAEWLIFSGNYIYPSLLASYE